MLEQYKKTFRGMQILMAIITVGILIWSRHVAVAATFFVTMQIFAVFGAMWGARLRGRIEGIRAQSARPPMRRA